MVSGETPAVPCPGCSCPDGSGLTVQDVEDVAEFFRRYNDSLFTPSDSGDVRLDGETGMPE
jgi:hypothetical protein